jgi:hypothetical protein
MYLLQLPPVFREAFSMQPLLHLVRMVLALSLLSFVRQEMHLGSFFSGSCESSRSLRIICSNIVLQHQPLLPQALNYGQSVAEPTFLFAMPPVVFLLHNVAIQHHPGYDAESYLVPIPHCPSFIQVSVRHHV